MENIKITITWNKGKPAGLWWNDKLIWGTKEVLPKINSLITELHLPVLEALQFCSIFISGTTARLIAALLVKMEEKIERFKVLQEQTKKQEQIDLALEWDW